MNGASKGLVLLLLSGILNAATMHDWPAQSIYQIDSQWQGSDGKIDRFSADGQHLRFVAFVYTHCISMCPVIVADLKRLEEKLPDNVRQRSLFTLISLDPDNDTADVMARFLAEQQLDKKQWQFLRGNQQDTRELALLLNIRYRQEGNEIAHSNVISLLDSRGILIHQRLGSGGLDEMIQKAQTALK